MAGAGFLGTDTEETIRRQFRRRLMTAGAQLTRGGEPRWTDVSEVDRREWNWIIDPTGQILSRRGERFCTGFLIGSRYFLTAGHCLGEVCRRYDEESNFSVSFNYHTGAEERRYEVKEIVEHGACRGVVDYGIFKLASPAASRVFGVLPLESSQFDRRQTKLAIAQHPDRQTKKLAWGSLLGYRGYGLFAHDMDTLGGSSGSPVAKIARKAVVGVHVSHPRDGSEENWALSIEEIAKVSERVQRKLAP